MAFVDAVYSRDVAAIVEARDAIVAACGADAMVDAAAVVGNFEMMTRIADATGTPLDDYSVEPSADLRSTLGIDALVSRHLPEPA